MFLIHCNYRLRLTSRTRVSLIFGAVIIFALLFYMLYKRREYTGPVVYVRKPGDEINI